ncbi:MAG: DNA recombination protein RmuC [Rhodobacterales bacterium]|nr:MAG: DNA recombination protein RmuC [Rhodobacterales bacterium]
MNAASLTLDDPRLWAALAGLALVALFLALLLVAVMRTGRSARQAEVLSRQVLGLGQAVQLLGQGQDQLAGGLRSVSDAQASARTEVVRLMEARLAEVQAGMQDRLHDNALRSARAFAGMQERMGEVLKGGELRTTKSLAELQARLATIDKAQENITRLSGDVLSLQDILSNKQTRGAFGEIQLADIVSKALPAGSYRLQATLSNGKRADCLVDLPEPPGPIAIDAKFPLEAYEALRAAGTQWEKAEAAKALRVAVRGHIRAIAEKYILEGETADGALMFLPSEAVYAELHADFGEVVREGFAAKVWIVSPTTCMATLNTMRAILKDARMREQAGAIRKALKQLGRDVELVAERARKLDAHFAQARADLDGIGVAAERACKRAARLDNFDFGEMTPGAEDPGLLPPEQP